MSIGVVVAIITFGATLVALVAASHQLWSAYRRRVPERMSWGLVERDVRDLIAKIRGDNFAPDVIVAIGRSGAILGGLLAGNMRNLPLALLDRQFIWDKNRREYMQSEFSDVHLGPGCNRVLVVVGEVYSGQTLAECLKRLGPAIQGMQVKTCTLVKSKTTTFNVDFYAYEVNKVVRPAWVMTADYHRVVDS